MLNSLRVGTLLLSFFIIFSCSRKNNFDEVDSYKRNCIKNDSLFSIIQNELMSDTLYIGKYITNDQDYAKFKNVVSDFKYSTLLDSLGIYDIHITSYSVEFGLKLIDKSHHYNIWYVYRNSPMEEKQTESVYIKKIYDSKYIVAEMF